MTADTTFHPVLHSSPLRNTEGACAASPHLPGVRRPTVGIPCRRRTICALLPALMLASTTAAAAVGPNITAVQPEQLPNYWTLTNYSTLTADAPNSGVNLSKPTCSAVTYMIGSDGVPRDIVVQKTIPAGDLKITAASLVKNMRYAPGPDNAASTPVFTYIIVPFNLPDAPAARKKITDACILKGFPRGYR